MKFMVLMLVVLMSPLLKAHTIEMVFNDESPLTWGMKIEILNTLERDCASGISEGSLKELKTHTIEPRPDAKVKRTRYLTELRSHYDYEGQTLTQTIVVETIPSEIPGLLEPELSVQILEGQCRGFQMAPANSPE